MAKFRITGPDGGVFEVNAPDDASEEQVLSYVQQNAGNASQGRSFAEPKLAQSASPRGKANGEVANENMGPKPLAFGIPIIGPYLEELSAGVASLPNKIAGIGPTYDQSLERMRARNRKAEADYPVQDFIGQNATGLAVGGPLLSKLFKPGASLVGNTIKSAAAGAGIGAVEGFGRGEGGIDNRIDSSVTNAALGGIIGGALPPVVAGVGAAANALSPTLARLRPNALAAQPEGVPQSAGAAGNPYWPNQPTLPLSRPEAAFSQRVANELSAANVRPGEIRARLNASDADAIGGPSPLALVDLDPSLGRLAGSFARQNKEVADAGQRFVAGRQTGITPLEGMPPNSGVPTRQAFEQANPIDPPAGQFERMRDNMRAALQVPHRSAYRVDQDLIATQQANSGPAYRQTFNAAAGIDMTPGVQPLLNQWRASMVNEVDGELLGRMRTAITMVERAIEPSGTVSHFERLNSAKKGIDKLIDRAAQSADRRSPEVVRILTGMKNELLDVMDNVPTVGRMYQNARAIFSSTAEMRNALEAGRNALTAGTEMSADAYRAMTAGEQQMFRVGLADALERQMAAAKRGNDVTQIFQTPRIQELISEVIPQDAAMRFGRNTQTEASTIRTRNEVFGNSKTAQRLADDESFNQMGDVIDSIRSAHSAASPTDAGLRVLRSIIDKVSGFRADEASVAARRLFTADRAELDDIIQQIEARMGPTRAAHFRSMLERYSINLSRQTAGAASTEVAPQPQQPPPPGSNPMRP